MEVIPYFLSIIVTIIALYWSAGQFRRKPGTPITGLFRYREDGPSTRARDKPEPNRPARPGPTPRARSQVR